MKRHTALRVLVTAGLIAGIATGLPAHADTDEEALRIVPPASTTPDIAPVQGFFAPVHSIAPQTWGLIKRTEDLRGETRREASSEAERFTLKGDVFFDIDEATLTSEAEDKLGEIAEELREMEIAKIDVGGHTDTVRSHAHNDELSEARAGTVADFLRDRLDDVDITAKGYGKRELAAPEEGSEEEIKEARSRNRRVEITVTFRDEGGQGDLDEQSGQD